MLASQKHKFTRFLPLCSRSIFTAPRIRNRFLFTLRQQQPLFTQQCVQFSRTTEIPRQEDNGTIQEKENHQDSTHNKAIRVWLLTIGGLVFGIVIVGGLTRLTESGLSMVEWKPLGHLPPITTEEWQKEFEHYQQFPEYKKYEQIWYSC